jgi:glycosyltransferase involved in cell wall biosynthesis
MSKKINSKKKINLFLFAPFKAPFIEIDVKILTEFVTVNVTISNGFSALYAIFKNIIVNDIIYFWFGSVYAGFGVVLSKLFRKRSIVIIGGIDAVSEPDFDYGIWLNPWKAFFLKKTLRFADFILVVAPNLKYNLMNFINYSGRNIFYLPTGYDTEYWKPAGKKEKFILSIGACDSIKKFKKKGFDILVEAAYLLPESKIIIIGVKSFVIEEMGLEFPDNLQFIDYLPQNQLLPYYQRAKVFCQPSRSEGMPNTLCEAMACGCIPVGSDKDGIPVAMGDCGYIVPAEDIGALSATLKRALLDNVSKGLKARHRIVDKFPYDKRRLGLKTLILNNEPPLEKTS